MIESDRSTHASTAADADAATTPSPAAREVQAESAGLYSNPKVDAKTGATPGVATACRDLGVGDLSAALVKFNCKPPGQ